jgi:hypothetical protein
MGRLASRKSGLGTFSDSGRNRVPAPDNVAALVPQNPPGMRVHSDVRGFPKWVRRSSSCTDLWWGRDHDDDNDVLLRAGGHGCSTSAPMAERERWDMRGERERGGGGVAGGGDASAGRTRSGQPVPARPCAGQAAASSSCSTSLCLSTWTTSTRPRAAAVGDGLALRDDNSRRR